MADQNDDNVNDNQDDNDTNSQDLSNKKASLAEEHQALLKQMVAEELKQMKANVDKAYKKAEETTRENARLKAEAQEKQRKQLEDEGKHYEAAKLKLAELEEEKKILQDRLTSVTRDRELEKHLGSLEFRNDFARETAFKAILPELVQDEDGSWVHKSGASINDYLKAFAKDPNKDFLFKPKDNSGAGSNSNKNSASMSRPKTLSGMSTEELLALADSGKLGSITF
jgi:DNA repair exonuclease SbcCD ATPase subunit